MPDPLAAPPAPPPDAAPEPARRGGDPTLAVACRGLSAEAEAVVRDWFAGRLTDYTLSGERSVYLPVSVDGWPRLKIKGAGHKGRAIRFGKRLDRGPPAPLFDYDGRRMEDVALSHAGACVGGASMQQAVTEWRMTETVRALGLPAVPCLGCGSVSNGRRTSWFSVFGWDPAWKDTLRPPHGTPEDYRTLAFESGRLTLQLAVRHHLVGFSWLIRDAEGRPMLKDLHPFRRLDPLNASQVSWVMQVAYALHVTAINGRILAEAYHGDAAPPDVPVQMFRSALPGATVADWDRFRFELVAPFMIGTPKRFRPEALLARLEADPIAAALMALCPPAFERPR